MFFDAGELRLCQEKEQYFVSKVGGRGPISFLG